MKIYCISGLGADQRVFHNLKIPGHTLEFIQWIPPFPDEGLTDYVFRLKKQIDLKHPFALLGVSFGGVVAIELSRIVPARKVFLISSIPHFSLVSRKFRIAMFLNLHKLFTKKEMTKFDMILGFLFRTKTDDGKKLLVQIVNDTDERFLKWALKALNKWNRKEKPKCIRIHGTNDHLIPLKGKADFKIEGGHWIIYEQGEEVSQIVADQMNQT